MVNKLASAMLDGLFPNYCYLCGLHSRSSLPLCRACRDDLQANRYSCQHCAIPLPPGTDRLSPLICGSCLQKPPPFHQVHAPWLYTEQLAYLIQRWKYKGERRLTPLLATLWLQGSSSHEPVDLLVPVPLHWRRLWQRGFNQSELLCRQLRASSAMIASARFEPRAVRRLRATAAQSGMNSAQRASNLQGAFTACRPCDNLRVAIVDDVLTTGATATAMATALREAGAAHIEVWCVARTPAPGG